MAYFTLRFRNPAGDVLFESDFTLHELIPVVRDLLRSLAHEPEIAANPTGYRVLLTPGYGESPPLSPAEAPPSPPPAPAAPGGLLQISEQDVDAYAPVSIVDELEAYYNPGTSGLCLACPERLRCPGSGSATRHDLSGWIELAPDALRSNEPVTYFHLRLESAGGRVLHEGPVRLYKLQFFVSMVAELLLARGRLPRPPAGMANRAEIIARFEGQPQIDPLLLPGRRPRVVLRGRRLPVEPPEPPRRLVDWDSLEEEPRAAASAEPPSPPLPDPDPVDLDIKVFPTENDPLAHRPPPSGDPAGGAELGRSGLPVFLHRSVFDDLEAQRRNLRGEAGGILIGDAFLDPETGRPYVEIVAALPATDERGEWVTVNLDSHLLRQIQERVDREFPGRRTVGWYHFHLLRVAVRNTGALIGVSILGEPLSLLEEEVFLHRNFFTQPWHLGLIINASEVSETLGLRFYHLENGELAAADSYRLVS